MERRHGTGRERERGGEGKKGVKKEKRGGEGWMEIEAKQEIKVWGGGGGGISRHFHTSGKSGSYSQ